MYVEAHPSAIAEGASIEGSVEVQMTSARNQTIKIIGKVHIIGRPKKITLKKKGKVPIKVGLLDIEDFITPNDHVFDVKLESLEDTSVVSLSRLAAEDLVAVTSKVSLYIATRVTKDKVCSVKYLDGQLVFDILIGKDVTQTFVECILKPDSIDIINTTDD